MKSTEYILAMMAYASKDSAELTLEFSAYKLRSEEVKRLGKNVKRRFNKSLNNAWVQMYSRPWYGRRKNV